MHTRPRGPQLFDCNLGAESNATTQPKAKPRKPNGRPAPNAVPKASAICVAKASQSVIQGSFMREPRPGQLMS